jgi:hypothetical protein
MTSDALIENYGVVQFLLLEHKNYIPILILMERRNQAMIIIFK